MLATALAVCACHQGRRVRFTTLAGLANELQEAQGGSPQAIAPGPAQAVTPRGNDWGNAPRRTQTHSRRHFKRAERVT
jgi:hypothetical protein